MLQNELDVAEQNLAAYQGRLDEVSSLLPKDRQSLSDCKIPAVWLAAALAGKLLPPYHLGLSSCACSFAAAVRRGKPSDEVVTAVEQLGALVSQLDRGKPPLGSAAAAGHHR